MSDQENQTEKKSNGGVWILIAIIALLGAAALGWMYANESKSYENCKTRNAQLEKEMEGMNNALSGYIDGETSDLKTDFQEMLNTYDLLIEKDASKADSLRMQKDSINLLLDQMNDQKYRSYREIDKLKKRNSRLRDIMKRYILTIDSLNTLNIDLSSRLDRTSSQLDETTTERDMLKEQNDQNAELLAKGAKLNAFNFNSQALRYRLNGSTTDVNRAGRADIISSEFTIGENTIARTGDKMIYMQVIDPNGQVLVSRPNNIVKIAGREIVYTGSRKISYLGQQLDMKIVHNLKEKEIPSGNYDVRIFADGALIGKDTFTLK